MGNQGLTPNAASDFADRKRSMTKVYTDVKQRKVFPSPQDYKSSITKNNDIDAKRQSRHAINESGQFGSNSTFYGSASKSQGPCLVTERVSRQLRPVFKEAAEALQKYVTEHSRKN
ncbi:hypothetical protein CcBV_32.12 [Bracoviriform congregatae]|uniref:Uncharacterized protein n=1 Tax=Bracoviriform congregatae TaxID=39640 RepID=Q5ZNT7_9VIRU|nr:hypothetical protein CcBV_32.12 [Bracoviriform congregatae]CAG18442.1 hypothetical protein CcBV_32.12 [Bracoviriform congregatae]